MRACAIDAQIGRKSQHADSVNTRPDETSEHGRVFRTDESPLLSLVNRFLENAESPRSRSAWNGCTLVCISPAEHHFKIGGMLRRKADVGQRHGFHTRGKPLSRFGSSSLKDLRELLEPRFPDRCE